MPLLFIHHLLYQGLINRKTRDTYDLKNKNDPIAILDDAAITADIGSVNVLENHGYQNWKGNGLTTINPTTDISNGFNPNSTPEQ